MYLLQFFLTGCLLAIYGGALFQNDRIKSACHLPESKKIAKTNIVMSLMFIGYIVIAACQVLLFFSGTAQA